MVKNHNVFLEGVLDKLSSKSKEFLHISDSIGRVLAEDVKARYASPHNDLATIDGYAVNSDNIVKIPEILRLIGKSTAAKPFLSEVKPCQAIEITAGAVVPKGVNTIIPFDSAKKTRNKIEITCEVISGQNICYKGFDFDVGEVVLRRGKKITARDVGLAAAMKSPWVPVFCKPRIGILAIGNELSMLGDEHERNRITSSSSLILSALVESCGASVVNLGIANDSISSLKNHINSVEGVDLLVTIGGTSLSAGEMMYKILGNNKKYFDETKVNISKPEPVLFSVRKSLPILALPGSPISAKICATLFLRPPINKMLEFNEKSNSTAILDRDLDANDLQMDYTFASLTVDNDHKNIALPVSSFDRVLLSSLSKSDCIMKVNKENSKNGDVVEVIHFIDG